MRAWTTILACGLLLWTTAFAGAQDRGPDGTADEQAWAENMRERLERRLEALREMEAQVVDALRRLDEGASPREALRAVEPSGRRPRGERRADGPPPERAWGRPRERPSERGTRPDTEAADLEEIREFVRTHLPSIAEQVSRAEAQDPRAARRLLQRLEPRIRVILDERARDPELAALRLEDFRIGLDVMETTRRVRALAGAENSSPERLEQARDRLAELFGRQFDVRLVLQEHEIARLETRIAELRREVATKRLRRDAVVDTLVDEVIERVSD